MNCKHIWTPEDTNRWVCKKCMATKWIDGRNVCHYYDSDGNHMPYEVADGDKDVLYVERELAKRETNRRFNK